MPRLIGVRGSGQDGWQWFVMQGERGRRRPRPWLIAPLIAVAAAIVLAVALPLHGVQEVAAHAPSGAIFTTEADGDPVNANIYNNKHKVHLNGGPPPGAPDDAAGLDDGDYWFQVTDPSGAVLLSSDALECRRIRVLNGVIIGSVDTAGSLNNASVSNGNNHSTPCPHHVHDDDTKADPDARTVHLMPYANTPNPGGVYKVWVTPAGSGPITSDPLGDLLPGCSLTDIDCGEGRFHGFDPGHTKTDNFKVKGGPRGSISGVKWYDANEDGVFNADEDPIEGWPIKVCNVGDITQTNGGGFNIPNEDECDVVFTDSNGAYTLTNLRGATYCIREALARDVDSDPADPDFNTFDWKQTFPTDPATDLLFGSTTNGTVTGTEGCNDTGTFDADDMNGVHVVVLAAGQSVIDINFGNVAFFAGGLTMGYWKTHSALGPAGPRDDTYDQLPITLGLAAPDIDPPEEVVETEADAVAVFDGADCSGDCISMLKAQLLAAKLNCLKFAAFCSQTFAGTTTSVQDVIDAADQLLDDVANGVISGDAAIKAAAEPLKNLLDAANNNASVPVFNPLPSPPSPLCFVGFSGLPSATGLPPAFICP